MKFIHCSDIHLGKTLNDNEERYRDYFKALSEVIKLTIENKADFLLIAGDLFHEGSVFPSTLADTVETLKPLKDAGIPIIAIEGNHDMFRRRRDESWLHFLSRHGYLKLLRPEINAGAGTITFPPYDNDNAVGGTIDYKGLSIYGIGYYGALTGRMLELTLQSLPEKADIGIFHGGVWDHDIITIGRVTTDEIIPLEQKFRYVALGHGHRPYEVPDHKFNDKQVRKFAFNPGSIEIVNREEARVRGSEFGKAYLVEINGDDVKTEILKIPRRKVIDLRIEIDNIDNAQKAMDKIRTNLEDAAKKAGNGSRPVLFLDIIGKTDFDPFELDTSQIEEEARRIINPVVALVTNQSSNFGTGGDMNSTGDLNTLFREAISDLLNSNPECSKNPDLALDLIFEMKKRVIDDKNTDMEDIMELIHKTRLKLNE